MHSAMDFLLRHGYIVIFVAVFIEQIGLPIPSGPVLLAAGALAGFHRLNLAPALALAAAASLICDSLWFTLGRRRGGSVLKFVCRVAIEPDTCVSKTHSAYLRYGPESLLISKFLPWFGTLGPPLAGMFNLAVWRFLLIDAGGALLWAGALYCSCPNELSSVRAALRLKRHGVTRLHALQGGFSGWQALGFPVDTPLSRVARA